MSDDSRRPGYFDDLYSADPDPWRFETSAYEAGKYADTIASLPELRYLAALEIGCSIGVLTERLAARADAVLGIDIAQAAIDQAADRCAARANVRFERMITPETMPIGRFDLIMLSEVLYYFDPGTLGVLADRLRPLCAPGADLVLVHWLGLTPDYPQTGDEAVAAFIAATGDWTEVMRQQRRIDYRLDVLRAVQA